MSGRQAYRELFRVRTFTLLAVSSGIGALFYGSIGTWSPTFFVRYRHVGGAVGHRDQPPGARWTRRVLLSGWLADYLTFRGFRAGRVLVGGVARLLSLPLFALTFLISNTPLMLVTFTLAAMCLVAPQAPMNAARRCAACPAARPGTAMDVVLQSVCATMLPRSSACSPTRTACRPFLVLVPLMGVSGILLLCDPPILREERRLREIVRAEALDDEGGGA